MGLGRKKLSRFFDILPNWHISFSMIASHIHIHIHIHIVCFQDGRTYFLLEDFFYIILEGRL